MRQIARIRKKLSGSVEGCPKPREKSPGIDLKPPLTLNPRNILQTHNVMLSLYRVENVIFANLMGQARKNLHDKACILENHM